MALQLPQTRTAGVYLIENGTTGKVYVGSSQDIADRLKRHLRLLRAGKHHSLKLQRSFDKHGEAAFRFKTLLRCAPQALLFFEQRTIAAFDSVTHGYNIAEVAGAPMRGRKHTTGTKEKMSAAGLGKQKSPEHAKAIGEGQRGIPKTQKNREGIKKSWETRRLTPVSEETRKKLSDAGLGREVSETSRQATISRNKARAGEVRGPLTLTPEGLQGRVAANRARKGTHHRAEILEDLKKAKQATWAARKAAGIHTRRWYANRGLQVPGETPTTNPPSDGVATPTQPT